MPPPKKLSVAVTGPTGEIGRAFIRALERSREIGEIRGMARSPFDPEAYGWRKTDYVRGDILDPRAVQSFIAGADVAVHLAFIIFGDRSETRSINLEGSRNVFEATVASGCERFVYTSSVSAYGFHADNPQPLTEEVEPRGTEGFYYSAQKAELERTLDEVLEGSDTKAWVFRPSIVGGPDSPALVNNMPYLQAAEALPGPLRRALDALPTPTPVLPDFGTPLQLVHADDVATALRSAVLGRGKPGVYNLAAKGEVQIADVASALGWRSVKVPKAAIAATAQLLDRMPLAPARAEWLHALRIPVIMDTAKARRELRWRPKFDVAETLAETVAGAREETAG
ncbi:MAG: NAD-dependent epimerase/dehydratase family protein [Solirubrobacterales bacterium]